MYLATSEENVGVVLMAERGKKQIPVYFVSRTLDGAELKYLELKKLILALVYAARKLRRYFQAHPIQVLNDKPIKQILAKLEKSGRIAKWAVELGEHEIKFRGRNSIKGQTLADFLAETPLIENRVAKNEEVKRKEPEPENAWKLFTDGASSSDGVRAVLMVVSPEGKEYTYALRFEFETTNNEAEYEALLAGLRIAKEMEIRELIIFVDSQLVANQVKGLFEARQPTIKQYLEKTMNLFEVIQNKSITEKGVADIAKEEGDNWMTPIREYLRSGALPDNPQKARKLRIKASLYKMVEENLYRRSYLSPWLRCVRPMLAKKIIKEVHEGSCGMNSGLRFGRPQAIISDNGKQFVEGTFPAFYTKLGTLQASTSVYHPQANGQVEVTNREIIKGMERRLGKAHQAWIDELPQVLWAHRTTPKSSNRETPFSMVYGSEAVIPIEISMETKRVQDFDPKGNKKR
ncbi:reverse transcriptase domain-containing protein [Tanacetum coccineum]